MCVCFEVLDVGGVGWTALYHNQSFEFFFCIRLFRSRRAQLLRACVRPLGLVQYKTDYELQLVIQERRAGSN